MKKIDLHTHSNGSDGSFSPSELVERAVKNNLSAMALTDHDTVAGIEEAMRAAEKYKKTFQLIPGTELSVGYKDGDIHIVGLCIDHKHKAFCEMSELMVQRRIERNKTMLGRLQAAGIPITMEMLTGDNPDTVVTRAHFARALINLGTVSSMEKAFEKYLNHDSPFYVQREYIQPKQAIRTILNAGGVPILAHPLHYGLPFEELNALVAQLKDLGLMGIEVLYSTHTNQQEAMARTLASRYDLLMSGGSDFHGKNKPAIELGSGLGNLQIPYEYLEKIAKACNYPLYS